MIRIFVADDSATARTLLVSLLSAEPDCPIVGEATTGREAVDLAERLTPDLITMDVQMPMMDGLEATKQIIVARLGQSSSSPARRAPTRSTSRSMRREPVP